MSGTTTTLAELPSLKGKALGVSEWFEVTQDRVNTFADATDDHQWIHVDPARASGRVAVRRADRARLPHPVAVHPDVVAGPVGHRRDDGGSTTGSTGSASPPRCRWGRRSG